MFIEKTYMTQLIAIWDNSLGKNTREDTMYLFQLHEENKKSKKLQAEQEQILKNVIEATKQKEIQTQEDLRRREERLEQSFEKREELSREDMRRQKESFERRLKDLEEQSNHDREKAKEEEKKREEEMEKMRSKTAEDQKKMDDLHKQLREKELQVIPVQQPQLTTTFVIFLYLFEKKSEFRLARTLENQELTIDSSWLSSKYSSH